MYEPICPPPCHIHDHEDRRRKQEAERKRLARQQQFDILREQILQHAAATLQADLQEEQATAAGESSEGGLAEGGLEGVMATLMTQLSELEATLTPAPRGADAKGEKPTGACGYNCPCAHQKCRQISVMHGLQWPINSTRIVR